MPYLFATQDEDYTDFSGGRVIYSQPGLPAFPVRLASEIFQRALAHIYQHTPFTPGQRLTLYDPTCGGAYHLAALGLLHGADIGAILASDVDKQAVTLARRNLELLSPSGLDLREQEIRAMLEKYGKESHAGALRSLTALREKLQAFPPIRTQVFQANALDPAGLVNELSGETIQMVICDVPYGQLSTWQAPAGSAGNMHSPVWQMLDALRPCFPAPTILAIAADKSQKIAHEHYTRLERFQIGKRQVTILITQPNKNASR